MNWSFWSLGLLLAQAEAAPAAEGAPQGNPLLQFMPIILIGILGYFILLRPQMRQQREQQDRINKLKKNDKIVTKSGIYGTVYSIDKEQNRVTLKIDEATNTKIDVTLNSVEYLLGDDEPPAEKKD